MGIIQDRWKLSTFHLRANGVLMPFDFNRYLQVVQDEIVALTRVIQIQSVEVARLNTVRDSAVGWGESRKARQAADCAQEELDILEKTLREAQEPLYAPTTFVSLDQPLAMGTIRIRFPRAGARRRKEDNTLPNYTDQVRKCDEFLKYRGAHLEYLYQEKRVALLQGFLNEIRLWGKTRLEEELVRRESERQHNRPVGHHFNLFSNDNLLIDFDPSDPAGVFLNAVILELHALIQQKTVPSAASPVEQAVMAVVGTCTTLLELQKKNQELKSVFPVDLHRVIDDTFRREIEKLLKRETK